MSYVKQTWATGDVITAEKLNHMEDGIETNSNVAIYTVNTSDNTVTCNKTYSEVRAMVEEGGRHAVLRQDTGLGAVIDLPLYLAFVYVNKVGFTTLAFDDDGVYIQLITHNSDNSMTLATTEIQTVTQGE